MAFVTLGVAGEYVAEFTTLLKSDFYKKRVSKWSTGLLVVALVFESTATIKTNAANNLAIADLENRAQQAAKLAGTLGVSVDRLGQFVKDKSAAIDSAVNTMNLTSTKVEKKLSGIESAVKGLVPRSLSREQREKLSNFLRAGQGNVQITNDLGVPDSRAYSEDLGRAFQNSGWKVESGSVIAPVNPPQHGVGLIVQNPSLLTAKQQLIVLAFAAVGVPLDVTKGIVDYPPRGPGEPPLDGRILISHEMK
jgi:hypothetical protein